MPVRQKALVVQPARRHVAVRLVVPKKNFCHVLFSFVLFYFVLSVDERSRSPAACRTTRQRTGDELAEKPSVLGDVSLVVCGCAKGRSAHTHGNRLDHRSIASVTMPADGADAAN